MDHGKDHVLDHGNLMKRTDGLPGARPAARQEA